MAWVRRSRPCLAEPPAESPSTRNSSDRAGSFSWQSASLPGRPDVERALAAGHFPGLAGGFTGPGGIDELAYDCLGVGRALQQEFLKFLGHDGLDHGLDLGGNQLVLGLG